MLASFVLPFFPEPLPGQHEVVASPRGGKQKTRHGNGADWEVVMALVWRVGVWVWAMELCGVVW